MNKSAHMLSDQIADLIASLTDAIERYEHSVHYKQQLLAALTSLYSVQHALDTVNMPGARPLNECLAVVSENWLKSFQEQKDSG